VSSLFGDTLRRAHRPPRLTSTVNDRGDCSGGGCPSGPSVGGGGAPVGESEEPRDEGVGGGGERLGARVQPDYQTGVRGGRDLTRMHSGTVRYIHVSLEERWEAPCAEEGSLNSLRWCSGGPKTPGGTLPCVASLHCRGEGSGWPRGGEPAGVGRGVLEGGARRGSHDGRGQAGGVRNRLPFS